MVPKRIAYGPKLEQEKGLGLTLAIDPFCRISSFDELPTVISPDQDDRIVGKLAFLQCIQQYSEAIIHIAMTNDSAAQEQIARHHCCD